MGTRRWTDGSLARNRAERALAKNKHGPRRNRECSHRRKRPRFVTTLETLGFELDGMSPEMLAHRYRRGAASIDVLAPEGLSERTSLVTTPPGHTLQVPGGTQALQRAELVEVSFGGRSGWIRRPSLLGAIVGKACAVDVDDAKQNQELDLALLLSFVADPFAMRQELTAKDRQRIAPRRIMLDPDHRVWQSMDGNEAESARTALAVLLGLLNQFPLFRSLVTQSG